MGIEDESEMATSVEKTLQRLQGLQGFYIKQEWEALEQVSSCYEQSNTYLISSIPERKEDREKGKEGSIKYFEAEEKTGVCCRICCGENRSFSFSLLDFESKKKVVALKRDWRCCGWAVIPCCAHRVDVHWTLDKNTGETIGSTSKKTLAAQVQAPWFHGGCIFPTWYLKDSEGNYTGKVHGSSCWWCPCCVCDACGADFTVENKEGKTVGHLKKLGVSNCKDCLLELKTEADKYYIEFDEKEDLDLNYKLSVLAAAFQIDFNFFEDKRGINECHCCDLYMCGYALPCVPLCCLAACCCNTKDKKNKDPLHGAPAEQVMAV